MNDGRGAPSRGSAPAVGVSRDVLFELRTIGKATRCAAIDAATGVEVVVMGPATATEAQMKALALRKLKMRLGNE